MIASMKGLSSLVGVCEKGRRAGSTVGEGGGVGGQHTIPRFCL